MVGVVYCYYNGRKVVSNNTYLICWKLNIVTILCNEVSFWNVLLLEWSIDSLFVCKIFLKKSLIWVYVIISNFDFFSTCAIVCTYYVHGCECWTFKLIKKFVICRVMYFILYIIVPYKSACYFKSCLKI